MSQWCPVLLQQWSSAIGCKLVNPRQETMGNLKCPMSEQWANFMPKTQHVDVDLFFRGYASIVKYIYTVYHI